ncbi:MAG: insulinase family protein [Deltaproteobacteria bacterium]|nr:insulinase family protein [Deltaproteobacteria bacterium]
MHAQPSCASERSSPCEHSSETKAAGTRVRSVALLIPLLLLPLLLLPLACPAAASEAAAQIEDPALRLQREVLDNGLEVLLLEDHGTPVVSVQLWVRAGSRDEGFYTGIAHLFEHMMFKGSKHLGPEEHAQLIGARGGRINAFTSRDVTVYHADVTAESLPLVIDLEAERLAHLDISEETLTSERQVVLEERRLRVEDRPGGLAFEALAASLWVAHPYRWPVIGWRSDVESVTVEACREFFDTYYSANNIALVVVGDFETKPTLAHITRAFGSLRSADAVPRRPTVEPPQRGERRATVHYEIQAPLLYAAWHAPATGHADGAALDVASLILSAGRSSRLYRALVYEDQVALYAHGGYMELSDAGMFYAVAGARPGVEISRVEEGFFAEIRKIAQEGVGEDEVDKAKRQLEVSLVNGLGTAHALANRVGSDMVAFGRVRPLDERLAEIQRVSADDVQRVVSQYLVDDQRSVIHVIAPPESSSQGEASP